MVASPDQLFTLGIWEYQRIQGIDKWWLLRPSNLLWRRWALWFDCSLVITTAAQWPGWIFPWSCVVHSIFLHGRWSRIKDVQHVGETKLNCFWHCYQSFVLWCYEGFNFGSRRKKGFSLGFMCPLASRLSHYNIPSNTNETTMANASQWFAD